MEASSPASFGTTFDPSALPPREAEPVLVMFSGGSDSTLTASLLSERHPVVHLVTYQHRAMRFAAKSVNSCEMLRKAHGADRFVYSMMDVNDLMSRIFVRQLPCDLREYGTYALPMCCGSCKLAMHVRSILYCHEHEIRYAADGSNMEMSELFPEQMAPVLALYRRMYHHYGIEFTHPVWDVHRSDHRLYERGVTGKRDYKTEHLVYSNQHSCAAGMMLYAFTLGVGLPLLGTSARKDVATRYIEEKIERFCIPFLDEALAMQPA